MANKILITTTQVGTQVHVAGSSFDSVRDAETITAIIAAGGRVLTETPELLAQAAIVASRRLRGESPETMDTLMLVSSTGDATDIVYDDTLGLPTLGTVTAQGAIDAIKLVAGTGPFTGTPASVDSISGAGSATTWSRGNHAHAHGSQSASTDHAAVVAGGANGFMTGADKTKLNTFDAVVIETADVTLIPLVTAGTDSTAANTTTFAGATYHVPRKCSFANAYMRLTAADAASAVRIAIYQEASGRAGTAALVATGVKAATGGAEQLVIPIVGALVPGICHVLIGIDSATASTARTWGNLAKDELNQNVPGSLAPVSFTTAITSTVTPPATFSPLSAGLASTADVAPMVRLGA